MEQLRYFLTNILIDYYYEKKKVLFCFYFSRVYVYFMQYKQINILS